MYVVWFCYIYENFRVIHKPLFALEELALEFKALYLLDPRFGSLYAGAGGLEPASLAVREKQLELLKPLYIKAIQLLETWNTSHG